MTRIVTPELFWQRCKPNENDSCVIYLGPGVRTPDGHIRIAYAGSKVYAHRLAYYLTYGVWPLMACHRCSVPACRRVGFGEDHLYAGTALTNAQDRDRAGRRRPPLRPAHWSSRVTQADMDELLEARLLGLPAGLLAQEYGISPATVRSVWRRATADSAAA